ncbi:APC family permease [Sedimentibacter saalensis]|nr:APC family permease [Sedimentibacter saalensis]
MSEKNIQMENNQPEGLNRNLRLLYVYALATGAILTFIGYWDTIFMSYCGPGTWLAFLLMTIIVLPIGFVYCELASLFPRVGGELLYNTIGMNKHMGFWASWLIMAAWVTVPASGMMGIIAWVDHVGNFNMTAKDIAIISSVVLVVYTFLSLNDIQIAGKVQTFMLFGALIGIVLTSIMFFTSPYWSFDNLRPMFRSVLRDGGMQGWVIGLGLIITPYFGFETVPQMVEEGTFPIKDSAKAILGSILTCGALYTLFFFALGGMAPWEQLIGLENGVVTKSFITITLMEDMLGWRVWPLLFGVFAILFTIGTCILGFWISAVRLIYAMGRQNFLPPIWSKVNKHHQPILPNIFILVISLAFLLIMNSSTFMNDFFNIMSFSCAVAYALTMISAIRIKQKHPEWEAPFKLKGGMGMRVLALAFALLAVLLCATGLGIGSWKSLGIYLIIGAFLWMYMVLGRWKSSSVIMYTPDGNKEY